MDEKNHVAVVASIANEKDEKLAKLNTFIATNAESSGHGEADDKQKSVMQGQTGNNLKENANEGRKNEEINNMTADNQGLNGGLEFVCGELRRDVEKKLPPSSAGPSSGRVVVAASSEVGQAPVGGDDVGVGGRHQLALQLDVEAREGHGVNQRRRASFPILTALFMLASAVFMVILEFGVIMQDPSLVNFHNRGAVFSKTSQDDSGKDEASLTTAVAAMNGDAHALLEREVSASFIAEAILHTKSGNGNFSCTYVAERGAFDGYYFCSELPYKVNMLTWHAGRPQNSNVCCMHWYEPGHSLWSTNHRHLCRPRGHDEILFAYSWGGSIDGMQCTSVDVSGESFMQDNYICVGSDPNPMLNVKISTAFWIVNMG